MVKNEMKASVINVKIRILENLKRKTVRHGRQ